MSAAATTQDSLQALMEELFKGDNAMTPPPPLYSPTSSMEPMEYVPKRKRTSKKIENSTVDTEAAAAAAAATSTWELKNAQDAPFISWADSNFQYTVQNPANHGDLLLKIQMYNRGRPTNSCGLYLDINRDNEILNVLKKLLFKLEDMWIDRNNGNLPKVEGMTQSIALLPSWRIISEEDIKMRTTRKSRGGSVGKQRKTKVTANKV